MGVEVGDAVVGRGPDARIAVIPRHPRRIRRQPAALARREPDETRQQFGVPVDRAVGHVQQVPARDQYLRVGGVAVQRDRAHEWLWARKTGPPQRPLHVRARDQTVSGRTYLHDHLAPVGQPDPENAREMTRLEQDLADAGTQPPVAPRVEPRRRRSHAADSASSRSARVSSARSAIPSPASACTPPS
jgi:hypothetical protein